MAWSTPLTAVANAALTAAQWNASVRDNLLETAVAKASAATGYYVATGVNTLGERFAAGDNVDTVETTVSTTYTNLATNGPVVTVTSGTAMLVLINAQQENNTANQPSRTSFEHTGATVSAATDSRAIITQNAAGNVISAARCALQGVTAGSNTVRMQYRVGANTGTFAFRRIIVMPF
jgi:hypothetical protein